MIWTSLDTEIALLATLSALACALPGCFLVLRRMSMMGDAISHSVLPGLAVAYLATGSRSSLTMFVGAALAGLLTAYLVHAVHRAGKVEEGASMGVVFTSLFALGLLLLVRGADRVDLDPSCVLYGAIEVAPLDRISAFGWDLPRAALVLGVTLLLTALLLFAFHKPLVLASFDPGLAHCLGLSPRLVDLGLMALVAVTAVAAFETVGSILVIAMLIVPGATAGLLSNRVSSYLALTCLAAILSAWLGHWGAIALPPLIGFEDTSTAGMMATASGLLFTLAVLIAPEKGILSRLLRQLRLRFRIRGEDILGFLHRLGEEGRSLTPQDLEILDRLLVLRAWERTLVLARLRQMGLVQTSENTYTLTPAGAERARQLVRTHRVWELYLHRHLNTSLSRVHEAAHLLEHSTEPNETSRLYRELGEPTHDPHGRAIPEETAGSEALASDAGSQGPPSSGTEAQTL